MRALASQFPRTANSFSALAGAFFGRLLEMGPAFHFPEKTLALHLLLQRAQGLLDIIVADDDLYDGTLSIQFRSGRGGTPCAIRRMGYL